MDVSDLNRKEQDNKKMVFVFNPSNKDFKFKFDGKEYDVPSRDFKEFPLHIANHAKKHLVNYLINTRDIGIISPEQRAELLKEIEVNDE